MLIDIKQLRIQLEYLFLIIGIIIILLIAYYTYNIHDLLPFGLAFIALIYIVFLNASFIGNALLVDKESLPKLYGLLENIANKVRIKTPKLYIIQSPELNAYTLGILRPSIIITSGLLDILTEEELEFVIGHEVGHILFKHYFINTLISPAGEKVIGATYIFGYWSRLAELSADRVGLYISGTIDNAVSALTKIAVGVKTQKNMNTMDFISQYHQINDFFEIVGETISDHPYTVKRIYKLVQFYSSNKDLFDDSF